MIQWRSVSKQDCVSLTQSEELLGIVKILIIEYLFIFIRRVLFGIVIETTVSVDLDSVLIQVIYVLFEGILEKLICL